MSKFPAGRPRSEHTTPQLSPVNSHFTMEPRQHASPREGHMNPPVSLPPLRHLSSTPPTPSAQRHGDPFRSILNPQAELADQQRNRRRSASQMESPSPVETPPSQNLPSISRPTSVESTHDEQHSSRSFQPPGRHLTRHLLSPKSPRLHRTQSLNLLNPPTGTIDAHQSPFLTASTRPSEPVTSQSSLPTPPIVGGGGRTTYFPGVPTTVPTPPPNVTRQDVRRPSVGFPQSGSASPIAQYSPYSQPNSIASSQYENTNASGHFVLTHSNVQMHDARMSSSSYESERNMIAMAPSGQSSIQLMTIKSQQGHNVQIPVDVQAASKVADEKRRRNAGASARFRARRKEKEREASMSISRLEQQLRHALEDTEYYRSERDYFKAVVFQMPDRERHYGRPPSPRLRRSSAPSHAPSSTRGGSVESYDYDEDVAREEERNVRRRTSNYHPEAGPASTVGAHGYPGSTFPTVNSTVSQSTSHSQQLGLHEQISPNTQHTHPGQSVYREPYTTDHGRFEGRGWGSGQHQPRDN